MERKAKNGDWASTLGRPMTSSSWCPNESAEDQIIFRYQILMEDYKDMRKAYSAKKRKLSKFKQTKLELLSVMKLFRRKLKSFGCNPTEINQFELKEQNPDDMRTCKHSRLKKYMNAGEVSLNCGNRKPRESTMDASFPQMVDLNWYPSQQDVDQTKSCAAAPTKPGMMPNLYVSNVDGVSRAESSKLLVVGQGFNKRCCRVKWKVPLVSTVHLLPPCES